MIAKLKALMAVAVVVFSSLPATAQDVPEQRVPSLVQAKLGQALMESVSPDKLPKKHDWSKFDQETERQKQEPPQNLGKLLGEIVPSK